MNRSKAIGIDLGTTNSCVAWVDDSGHTAMVANAEGDLLTPSVVLFDDAEVVVGKEARNASLVNPDRVAVWVKRDMGAPLYTRPIRGEYLPPEVIQSCILRKLKADLVQSLGPESHVVITVPAYFDEPRRKATSDAGEMAGLTVLDIVNEPTAGALAFGEVLGYLSPSGASRQTMTVMVYDLGGGTFDVTLLRLAPGNIQMIATDGDVQLGGYDWDTRLLNHVADAFQQIHGADPRKDATVVSRLYAAVVEAKHTLSARSQTMVRLEYAGHTFDCPVTRKQFEDMTLDLLERTAYTSRQLIAAARMQWHDVSRVLLVGGSTRMPAVSRMLQQMTGITPDHTVNPDEAVARGAALYACYLQGMRTPDAVRPGFAVTNVNSHSLGIEGIEVDTLRKKNVILIPRNSPLPAKRTERFATKADGQQSIVIQVLEGESTIPGECTAIGRTAIRNLPGGLPKGWPIDVTFEYATNGRLSVRAVVPGTHRETSLELERDVGLSREGIARWKDVMASFSGFSAFESVLSQAGAAPPAIMSPVSAAASPPPMPTPAPAAQALPPKAAAAHAPVGAMPAQPPHPAPMPMTPPPAMPQAPPGWAPGTAGIPPGAPAMPAAPQPMRGMGPSMPGMPGVPLAGPGMPMPASGMMPGNPYPMPGMPHGMPPGAMPGASVPGAELYPGSTGDQMASTFPMPTSEGVRLEPPSRIWINVVGHVLSAAVGLGTAYLILSWLFPDRFKWPF
jgi:molecular chaperone DnaK